MIFEIYIWIICFLSVYVSIFWIIVSNNKDKNKIKRKELPLVTIAIPAYNEERGIWNTLKSLTGMDYPKEKLEIIVVNDGSKDKTREKVEEFIKKNKSFNIILINQENKGKGAALNNALKIAKGEYFSVFDADSIAGKDVLKSMIEYFDSEKVGAVITAIKVYEPKTSIEKIQRLEYIFASFVRKLMGNVGTLHTTHGVLSLFNKDIIKKLNGFDEKNMTEDFEIAMKLRHNHYEIKMCEEGFCYTQVPSNFHSLWTQRVRWFRGFMSNNIKYKDMVMNKEYGLLGRFQIPLELITLALVFISVGLLGYNGIEYIVNLIYKIIILRWEIFDIGIHSFKELILGINWMIFFPSTISLIAGLYLYFKAHYYIKEKWRFHFASFIYLFVYPVLRSLQWIHAFYLESTKAKKRWR